MLRQSWGLGDEPLNGMDKKRTPQGGNLRALGSGTCIREQSQNYDNTFCSEMQAPHIGRGGGDLSMTGWEFFFVVLGVCSATSGLFRVIDRIEGK